MPLAHVTKGRVLAVNGTTVVFKPTSSTYELHLQTARPYDGPVNSPISAILRGTARKVYTVPSGGLFVTPILGPTRILQGRVKDLTATELAMTCVATFNVTLPKGAGAIEMARGPIEAGTLVNVTLLPGATFELAEAPKPAHTAALTAPAAPLE